jgi:hypothetical protein
MNGKSTFGFNFNMFKALLQNMVFQTVQVY